MQLSGSAQTALSFSLHMNFTLFQIDILLLGLAQSAFGVSFFFASLSTDKPTQDFPQVESQKRNASETTKMAAHSEGSFSQHAIVALFHTLGNASTLYCLSVLSVPLVLTVKATEPLFALALLKGLGFQDPHLNFTKLVSISIMVVGTSLASVREVQLDLTAFVAALMANCGFQLRNIYSKYVSKTSLKDPRTYANLSVCSAIIVAVMYVCKLSLHRDDQLVSTGHTNQNAPVMYVLLSGLCHTSYHFFSLRVLSHMSPVAHSVLNSLKRLFIIGTSAIIFSTSVTLVGIAGSVMVISGENLFWNVESSAAKITPLLMRSCLLKRE